MHEINKQAIIRDVWSLPGKGFSSSFPLMIRNNSTEYATMILLFCIPSSFAPLSPPTHYMLAQTGVRLGRCPVTRTGKRSPSPSTLFLWLCMKQPSMSKPGQHERILYLYTLPFPECVSMGGVVLNNGTGHGSFQKHWSTGGETQDLICKATADSA